MYWQSQTRAWLHASQTELPIGCSRRFHKTGLPKEGDNEEACCDKHALVCEYSLVCDIYILCSVLPPNVELYTFGKTSLNVILDKIRILFYYFYVIVFLCLHSIYQRCLAAVVFFLPPHWWIWLFVCFCDDISYQNQNVADEFEPCIYRYSNCFSILRT